jgi:hypothetical protein
MQYAEIKDGTVIKYPVDVRRENPNISIPENWSGGIINDREYVVVEATKRLNRDMEDVHPVFINNIWQENWVPRTVPKTEAIQRVFNQRFETQTQ